MRVFQGKRRVEERESGLSRFCSWLWGRESHFYNPHCGSEILLSMAIFREKGIIDKRAEEGERDVGFKASEAFQFYAAQSAKHANIMF